MKHSSAFISYLCYRTLYLSSILDGDHEKIDSYMEEMNNNLDKMDTDELLEVLNHIIIMDTIYNRK